MKRGPASLQTALVIASHGSRLLLELADGNTRQAIIRGRRLRPVSGDRVRLADSSGTLIVEEILPRDTVLARGGKQGGMQPLAANISQMLIVTAVLPPLDTFMLDKYLLAAERLGLETCILFNKIDLADTQERRRFRASFSRYVKLGYPVLLMSIKSGEGLETLRGRLQDQTSIVVGQSGVGKSSLLNTLLPSSDIRTGELSDKSKEGRHTTTTTHLYHIPGGGKVIDSPGVRDFQLWQMSDAEIAAGFRELCRYLGQCKFANCRHFGEPDCAVTAAVKDGKIDVQRYQSYLRLLNLSGG